MNAYVMHEPATLYKLVRKEEWVKSATQWFTSSIDNGNALHKITADRALDFVILSLHGNVDRLPYF